jgi:hypothetical protein
MLCGPDSRRVAATHAPVGVFLRFDVVKILSSHTPRMGDPPSHGLYRERPVALSGTQSRSTAETAAH